MGGIEGMDKKVSPEKSYKESVTEGKNQGIINIGINYGGIEKKSLEIGVVTSEKKRKEISSKEQTKIEGKGGKETRITFQGNNDNNKEKKGKGEWWKPKLGWKSKKPEKKKIRTRKKGKKLE